jgi:hypothetical protein
VQLRDHSIVRRFTPHRIVAIGGLNLDCAATVYRILRWDDGIAMAEEDPCLTAQKIQAMRQNSVEQP